MKPQEPRFKIGEHVTIHPACDWWMQGVKYGTVTKVGRLYVTVKAQGFNSSKRFPLDSDLLY